MDGILVIHKAVGMTSHDVVARVRKLLKQKRVGHAGTLDPAASGVLPICIGQGTRVAEYLSESGKAYSASIVFGIVTDTYDAEGTVLERASIEGLDRAKIEAALAHFMGAQMQMPPRYSAIKIQGQPAYKLARAGEEIEMAARPVTIYRLEIQNWEPPVLALDIECSKGTYIRSLAHDLGQQLGCGAHLGGLVRTRSGPFGLAESITLEQLAEAVESGTVEQFVRPADRALEAYPAIYVDEAGLERVRYGNAFWSEGAEIKGLARVYDAAGHFIALAEWDEGRGMWQPKKVLIG